MFVWRFAVAILAWRGVVLHAMAAFSSSPINPAPEVTRQPKDSSLFSLIARGTLPNEVLFISRQDEWDNTNYN